MPGPLQLYCTGGPLPRIIGSLYLKQNYILDFTSTLHNSIVNMTERYIYAKGAVSLLCALINIPMRFGVFLAHQSQKKVNMI